jgi:hypothetical protein
VRTTLDIDEDVLAAVKEIARRQNVSAGKLVSQLLRQALAGQTEPSPPQGSSRQGASVAGFRPFPKGQAIVTNDMVDRLRDVEGV